MPVGHMTDKELEAMHGDLMQVVPPDEHEKNARIIQKRPVGTHHGVLIGTGWHGAVRLSFFHPKRSDTLAGLDTATGETLFTSAQKTEKTSRGKIHAQDFPTLPKRIAASEIDIADVSGSHLNHVKGTQRTHWQNVESKGKETRPRRKKIIEEDVPWDTPTQPKPNTRCFTRYT